MSGPESAPEFAERLAAQEPFWLLPGHAPEFERELAEEVAARDRAVAAQALREAAEAEQFRGSALEKALRCATIADRRKAIQDWLRARAAAIENG